MDILPFLTALTTSATGPHRHNLAEVMTARADILSMSAQANAAVVSPQKPGRLSHTLRTALAARMARLSYAPALAALYLETLDGLNPAPSFTALAQSDALPEADTFVTALVRYADLVTVRPKDATQADIETLRHAGLTDAEIVHLAELIACVCYLSRLTLGMQALTGAEAGTLADMQAPATDKHTDARAQERTAGFTAEPLEWIPYLQPVKLEDATEEQRDAMKITPSNTKISDYVLTLAHDPESLAVRSPLFNAIMYGRDGLSRAGREMGALGCSLINHCLYCASVHARRFIQLTKRPELVETLFSEGPDACLNDEYWQPIFDFSVELTRTPATFSSADVRFLRDHGLSDLEIFDLICATGIFGWANRLMHTLGHSVSPLENGLRPTAFWKDTDMMDRSHTARTRWGAIIGSIGGNALEWYDFTIFSHMIPIISTLFFPKSAGSVSAILMSTALFGVGFLPGPSAASALVYMLTATAGRKQ